LNFLISPRQKANADFEAEMASLLTLLRRPYVVIEVWSRKLVAWDVSEREDAQIAADLVGRACLRERIAKGRQSLMLHADNGNALAGRHAGEQAGGAWGAQILLQAQG
jgi:transposase InsO family protein